MPVGAAIAGSAVIGGAATVYSAGKASDAQSKAAAAAAAQQKAQYEQTRADNLPFITAGQDATNSLTAQLPQLSSPFNMTQNNLEATPGYQFNLTQGLKATQNAAAARGLGLSGAAMKGAATYATGLADNTYKDQFNFDQTNKTNSYNKLLGVSQLGSNAANNVGTYGQLSANQIGTDLTGAGNAQAAAYLKSGNAIASGANSIGNYYMQQSYMNPLTGGGGGMYTPSIGGAPQFTGGSWNGTPYAT